MRPFVCLLIGILASCQAGYAQSCDCPAEFDLAVRKVEANYAGYPDKVITENEAALRRLTNDLQEKAATINDPVQCALLIEDWMAFFRDQHLYIVYQSDEALDPKDTAAIRKRFAGTETLVVDEAALRQKWASAATDRDPIEGIWITDDSTYRMAIVRNETPRRTFAAVILAADGVFWRPGMVKAEFQPSGEPGRYDLIYYMRNHSHRRTTAKIQPGGRLALNNLSDWQRLVPAPQSVANNPQKQYQETPFAVLPVDQQTVLLRLGSFNDQYAADIDSMVQAHRPLLTSTPNLIIDLRGNGGGSDFSYEPVIPLLYTQPIITTSIEVLASEDNTAGWAELLNNENLPDDTRAFVADFVEQMRQQPGAFIPLPDDTTTLEKVHPNPERVAIIVDRECGSSAEQFLLAARQSTKVKLFGENSGGVLDYANLRPVVLECLPYALYIPTSRSKRLPENGIDNVGIPPDVRIPEGTRNWVRFTHRYLMTSWK